MQQEAQCACCEYKVFIFGDVSVLFCRLVLGSSNGWLALLGVRALQMAIERVMKFHHETLGLMYVITAPGEE